MNKVFKVVYSKSKGCYVVVPETAKNNNGKKKVLASVLAGLALVGAGAHMGTPVEAYRSPDGSVNTQNSRIDIAANAKPNNSVGVNSIVVGYQNTTDDNEGTTALGANNQAYGNSGLAIGNQNYANGGAATAIGAGNEARAGATVALGNKNNANATSAVAVGNYNNQNYTKGTWQTTPKQAGNYSTAVGSYNAALGDYSVSVGTMNTSHVADTVTIGQNNNAKTMGGISIGKNNLTDSTNGGTNFGATRNENSQIAIGRDNVATHLDTIAIGRETKATGSGATVVGARAEASGNNSIAIGQSGEGSPKVIASGVNSIAIGMQSQATGESAIAEGPGSRAGGKYGVALGRTSKANAEATTALGNAAEANIANGVALGSSSVTTTDKGVLGYNPSDPHERKYAPLTGNVQTATTAAVSIGNGQQMTRQLTGLAAGTADTDAVNVAQLKNVGVAVTGNTGKSDFLTDGGKLNVIGTGRVSTVAAHDGAKDSKITVGFDDKGMVKAGRNVTVNEVTVDGKTTYTINAADTAAKYDFLTNATANGGKLDGEATPTKVQSGTTINYAAGKNLTVKQDIETSLGQQTYTYSLNKDLKEIKSITNNGGPTMNFGPNNISITGGNLDLGNNNITNLKSGGDTINNAANIGDVIRISKANDKHIKPGEYAVDNNGKVTMTYVDGNNKDVPNETAVITGIAKQDLSNINNGGKTVIKNLAKEAIDMENGKNTTASHRDVNGVKTFKVDVEGDLTDITSITNKAGDGKIAFGGNQTVNVAGDHNISLNAKAGDITGLTNVTLDAPDFGKKGRAATEEQLSIVNNGFNNTVGLTGNTGATELQKLNKQGGLSFGVVGANNGEYIKTTASGSNVVADLSDSAKNKLNSTVEVQGKNAAKVTSSVVQNADGSTKTIYTVDVNNVKPTAASTEKVQAKADVAGSSDKNIAKVSPKAGENFGDAGATYEVNVSRNDVKDAAREAVTVNNANNNNNPITVTPVQDETNHNTTYQVTFDGDKAAKQIPLTYKANGTNDQKVTLDKGLNFTNGRNTTASVDAEGVVKYDVNKDLVNINSISNTTNGPKMEFGPNSINITNGPINMGDQNITNLKSGGDVVNNAANIGDVTRISKANDLHIAPTSSDRPGETTTSYAYDAASKSVTLKYNDGNGKNQAGTVAKIDLSGLADQIKDGYSFSTDAKGNVVGNHAVTAVGNGKTVSYAAGDNVTVKQDIDAATGEHTYTYALSNNIDLTPNGSLKIGDTIVNDGGLTIKNGPSVTKTGINAGNLNITNVKAGVNDTDAVNVKQLKDARTVVTSNDKSVTINKTENGNQVTYDLHVAPGAAQSVWNVKSTGNTTADSEAAAKTITDGKTVELAAGKNLTVKQTSNEDGAKVEYALSDDIKVGNDGKDGKDGVDGKIGVNGKDGSAVVINGKDGSIGLNGKDGKDGLTIRGANGQDGVNGTNGTNGITRIVYEDKNNNKHEVATTDDGLKFTGNNTDVVNKNKLNSLIKVQGEGVDKTTSTSFKSASGNINVKADGTDTLEVQLNKDLKNITSIKNDGPATMTIGGNEFKFDGGNVNMGGNNITNLKSGGDVIDNAANIGDVTRISKANDLHIAPTQSNRAGETTTSYSYDAADKSVTLKYNDGNGANQAGTIAKIDLSGLADQIKDGYSFSTDAKGNVVGNHAVTAVGNGKTVSYAAGDNLTINQHIDNATGEQTYTYALSNDIKVGNDGKDGKDGVDGKIGVNGKDGSAVVINGKDGSIGLNGKDGKDGLTIKGANGQDGVDGKNGKDGMTRIVYEDKNNNKHEVATTDDGMKYAGDDAQGADKSKVIAKKLNQTLDITGGADSTKLTENNIGVNNVDGKLKVQLAQNINLTPAGSLTIGDTKITDGGLVINNGPSITKGGINAGDLNITNVKAGVNDTDAVNVKQLKSAKTEVKAGDNVTVDKTIGADGQNIYTVNAKATNLGDAELNYTANNGAKQKVKLSEGLNFVDGNYTKASVDANGVVKYDVTLGKVKDGVDGKPGVDGDNGIATVKTVVDTINNSGWKGDVTGNTVGNHSATIVKPGTTVNFGAGKNLTVEQIVDAVTGNHTYNYALSDDIKVGNDGKDGKPGVDGKIGVNGKDGSAVVINGKDGSIGLNGKDGKDGLTFKGANGQDGVDGKNGTNGMTRIVYEDSNNNKHEVATTDDGLKFTGNNESVVNKNKLNSTVKVKGEGVTEEQEKTFESAAGNIAVTADGNDTLNIRLNKNIKGIDSIQTKEIHLGTPDNYTTIKKDGDRIKYGDKTFANTDDIWTIQANGTDVPANGGKVNVKGADGITVSKSANGEMTISGAGLGTMNSFNVKSSGNTTADSETAAKKITDGKTVEFSGGKNLTVKQTSDANGAKVEYALNNNVDLTNKGSLTIGDTKITDGGLVINNGPSVTKDGINAGNKQITNVEDGVNDTDAVNVRQLKAAKTNLVDGQNTKVTGDGSKANPYKVNVEGDLNKITSITNKEGDGKLEFKGDQVVNVAGDNTIKLDGKTGDITGLTNKTLDSADFATKGRAATEEQLKLVHEEAAKKSTEKVQAKADANNIAKVAPKAGDTFGAAGATYEVSVDKNDVKDAAREAVTVTGDNKAITVDVQPNATNHTTNYQVNFNGKEAAKQIPLTYKENGGNAKTVMLSEGLDFSNGVNTTAHTGANGKVSFDVKGDLTNITSISNNSNGPKVSFGGDTVNITGGNLNMGGNKITNVQRGTDDNDAVNVKQLKDSRTTLTSDDQSVVLKKTETADGGLNYDLSVKGAVDPRVDQLNEEIGRVGAQGAALSALKPMQYDPLEPTQIMAGYGNYRGNSAIAVGVAHYKNESTMFHGGLSWAGGSSHMMANAGVTWKVGNRDAEAAVADRYRKGPISSAYAVQTEMAAMKAQNAGLKGEVSDLKYENEQIKAQNAGLQSEVEVLKAQMAAMMAKMGM